VKKDYTKHLEEILNISKVLFAPLLKEIIKSTAKSETLANGFKACGLYARNPYDFECTKYLIAYESAIMPTDRSKNTKKEVGITINKSTFVNIIGRERFEKFGQISNIRLEKIRIS
jgi:hypothetical protein